jgi:hypothetical protein
LRAPGALSPCGGGVAHDARTSAASSAMAARHRTTRGSERMEWVLLEAAVALALAVFIVWWLMRGKK